MKNYLIAMIVAVSGMLSACGGGSGDPSVSVSVPPSFFIAPIINPGANRITGPNLTVSANLGDYLVNFSGTFILSGANNNVFFEPDLTGVVINVSGNNNVLVFTQGDTVSSLTVTGIGNTIYLPSGSSITVSGSGASTTEVRVYQL